MRLVHYSDEYCSPQGAAATFDKIDGPKDLLWLDTDKHIDLYDDDRHVGPTVERACQWFGQHLDRPAEMS